MTQLLKVLGLLFKMQADDITELESELLTARKRAWRSALAEEGQRAGCPKTPRPPSRSDLTELKSMSKEDAKSISQTYNADVERQLAKLYKANPRGNRTYYASNMTKWAANRALWKNAQIALQTEQTTRFYAQNRFRTMNGLKGGQYIFVGAPPVCEKCIRQFSKGIVGEAWVQSHPAPIHIGCPHEWQLLRTPRIPCDEIWLG